jgi:hypothetical protein
MPRATSSTNVIAMIGIDIGKAAIGTGEVFSKGHDFGAWFGPCA